MAESPDRRRSSRPHRSVRHGTDKISSQSIDKTDTAA